MDEDVFMVWGLQRKTATDAEPEWASEMDWADPQARETGGFGPFAAVFELRPSEEGMRNEH